MTIHLISVGKSVLQFLEYPYGRDDLDDAHADEIAAVAPALLAMADEVSSERVSATLTRWLADGGSAELTALCARLSPARWPSAVSAELDTFTKAAGLNARLTSGSTAVLITSDTAAGLTASLLNALALTGGDPARVRYLPGLPGTFEGLRGNAVIARVPRLDARSSDDFRAAMTYLGLLGRGLVHRPGHRQDENVRFYLSGGFKATIPYLIGLAEGMRSITTAKVTACVLHEATDKTIELPLRRLPRGVVTAELRSFAAGDVVDRRPDGNILEGYAYETTDDGRHWELTAFGAGLRALYGLPNEAL